MLLPSSPVLFRSLNKRHGRSFHGSRVFAINRDTDESESSLQLGNAGMELDYLLVKPPDQITPPCAQHSLEREGRECAEAAQD